MRRGEEEGILKIAVDVDAEHCIESLRRLFVRPGSATREWMEAAVADAFKRLIRPSIAVSYTHLDVYKRQKIECRTTGGNPEKWGFYRSGDTITASGSCMAQLSGIGKHATVNRW